MQWVDRELAADGADSLPLSDATRRGDIAEVSRLLRLGASPRARDYEALAWACLRGTGCLAASFAATATADAVRARGGEVLRLASSGGMEDVVDILLSRPAGDGGPLTSEDVAESRALEAARAAGHACVEATLFCAIARLPHRQ